MEIFMSTQVTIPVYQVILMLILSTIALLFGLLRLSLLISYLFALYWGYVVNMGLLTAAELSKMTGSSFVFLGSGILIVLLALIGLVTHRN